VQSVLKKEQKYESAGEMIRFWRQLKRVSQMDLALDIDISSRHLSFVETGKSRPSRNLVLRITHSLKMPLRQRNAILLKAGYAPEFEQGHLDSPSMKTVGDALRSMLEKHEPYPAFVVNTGYRILMKNSGYDQFVRLYAGENALKKYDNAIRILFSEDGLRNYVKDWTVVEHIVRTRILEEALSTQNSELAALYEEISPSEGSGKPIDFQLYGGLLVMSLVMEKNGRTARFFTTITTLGTPLDLTTQELRIEMLFPSDDETKTMFPLEL